MKKFYVSLVCLLTLTLTQAQTRYWRLAAGIPGNYNDPNNWSATIGGGPATVPDNTTDVILEHSSLIRVDLASVTVKSLTVTNSSTATLYTDMPVTFNAISSNPAAPALNINTNSILVDSINNSSDFIFQFPPLARGLIDGTWVFTGIASASPLNGSYFVADQDPGGNNPRVDVNGTIIIREHGDFATSEATTLFFNNNSIYAHARNGGTIPKATWDANSSLNISGVTTSAPQINFSTLPGQLGNLTFNSPTMISPVTWAIIDGTTVQGNFRILNTNNQPLTLGSSAGTSPIDYHVNGNFEIANGTNFVLGHPTTDKAYSLSVLGNYIQTGGIFSLRDDDFFGPIPFTQPTTLFLGGNFNQTAGTFTANSTVINTTTDLFVLEMNGAAPQTISAASNSIDNATHQVTFRMNNAAGATLNSSLEVGRLSFNSANKGILTTSTANVLTIANTSTTDALVVNAPANNGHVNGPVRRQTAEVAAYLFPTGKGGVYHGVEVIPTTTALSVYRAEYFNTAFGDLSVLPPLIGVSNQEYWVMSVDAGSAAAVQLSLNGTAVPGAGPTDKLVVAKYNGADWAAAKGTTGTTLTPGNSTAGSVKSENLASFTPGQFTFGFAPSGSLPIDLITFNAKKANGNTATINWKVSMNSTPASFNILRSTDGRNFSSIGFVSGVDQQENYGFNDLNLPQGTTYYRLSLTDKQGAATFSKIIAVLNGGKGLLITSMMPTVVVNGARLNVSASSKGNMQLIVTDMSGRIISSKVAGIVPGNQDILLDLHSLTAGAYHITGYMNGERTPTIRFIRQ